MVRIGVIGSGNIASRFIKEASYVSDVQVTAIYNPHIDSAMSLSFEELRQVSESAAHDGLVCMEALKTNALGLIADIGHYFSDKVLG